MEYLFKAIKYFNYWARLIFDGGIFKPVNTYYLIFLIVGCSGPVLGQSTKELIQSKIDSTWRTVQIHGNLPRAMELASELLSIEGSYIAHVNAWQVIGTGYFYKGEYESSLQSYSEGLSLAKKSKDTAQTAYILQSMAIVYDRRGLHQKSLELHLRSLAMWEALRDTSEIIFSLLKISNGQIMADRHQKAMNTNLRVIDLAGVTGDTTSMAYAYLGMGVVHKKQGNYSFAEKSNQEAIMLFTNTRNPVGAASARVNLALVFKSEGHLTQAYEDFEKLLTFFKKEDLAWGTMACVSNMAVCSNLMGMYDRALQEAQKGLGLSRALGQKVVEADMSNEIGIAYLGITQLDSALAWSLRSSAIAEKTSSIEKKRNAAKTLSDIYSATENFELALKHFKLFKQWNDSIFEKEESNEILALQTQFETEKKQIEIEKLEASGAHQRAMKNVYISGFVIIFLLSCVIINREIKRRKKAGRLLKSEKKLAILNTQRLEDELQFKNRELTSNALHLAQKHQIVRDLKTQMKAFIKDQSAHSIIQKISFDQSLDDQWEQFIQIFTETNPSFFENLIRNFSGLSKTDIRLCALIKMNLDNKVISNILNISDEGIKKARYRLRKKMELESGVDLNAELMNLS